MNRRNLLKLTALSSLFLLNSGTNKPTFANTSSKIKPKKIEPGDKVALVSPASNVTDLMDVYRAQEICDKLTLNTILPKSIVKTASGYKTRSAEERVDELHQAFSDKSIKAIFTIRGGFGSAELLEKLDFDLIKSNPKILCGYSDITALLTGINKKTGLVTFHSPVMLSNFDSVTYESFQNILFKNEAYGTIDNPVSNGVRASNPTITINGGKAKGELVGGNLSLLTSLIGTPFEIETKNKIIFIEDVGEAPYRLERMLTQMRMSGLLDNIAGVVIGKCDDCTAGSSQMSWDRSELEVYNYIFADKKYPVFYGLLFGHTSTQFTIPLGISAEIDSDKGSLNILESAVI